MEMKTLRRITSHKAGAGAGADAFAMAVNGRGAPQEMGSVGSSDTYASCNTQPFHSHGDLTADDDQSVFDPFLDNSNVYINPLQSYTAAKIKTFTSSGNAAALRSLGTSPLEETYKTLGSGAAAGLPPYRGGSRGSLKDPDTLKSWRNGFQKVSLLFVFQINTLFVLFERIQLAPRS